MRKNAGFTLVELSIVLVIIGLLVGGILAAQSMISTARANDYVRKLQQYNIALNNFHTTYNGLPGDSNKFIPAGDNDGAIETTGGCKGAYGGNERVQAFSHLSQAGMIKGNYVPYQPVMCSVGSHNNSMYEEAGVITPVFATSTLIKTTLGIQTNKIIPLLGSQDGGQYFTAFLPPMDMIVVDKKLDDGAGATGQFMTVEAFNYYDPCESVLATGTYPSDANSNADNTLCVLYWFPDIVPSSMPLG